MFVLLKAKNIFLCFLFMAVLISGLLILPKNHTYVNSDGGKIIVVDAGHGGIDGGAVGLLDIIEKDLNLEIAKKVERRLSENGFTVIMTRSEDISIHSEGKNTIKDKKTSDLLNRAELANKSGALLFVSIHLNTFEQESISGAQVFFKKNDQIGEACAKKIMTELKTLDGNNRRLEKLLPNPNLLFKKLAIPAVLIECGFISNNNDAALLKNSEYQERLAEKIAAGIIYQFHSSLLEVETA